MRRLEAQLAERMSTLEQNGDSIAVIERLCAYRAPQLYGISHIDRESCQREGDLWSTRRPTSIMDTIQGLDPHQRVELSGTDLSKPWALGGTV